MALNIKDETQLVDMDVRDMVVTYVAVQARQQQRRMVNRLIAHIAPQLEAARRDGHRPDTAALLREAWLELGFESFLLGTTEEPDATPRS